MSTDNNVIESSTENRKLETTPIDARFPNQNQAQHCWTRYNEWVLCLKKTEGDEDKCIKYKSFAHSICPEEWIEKWDGERDEGNFPGVRYPA